MERSTRIKARATFTDTTLAGVRASARENFDDFFGDSCYEIIEEDASADMVTDGGRVILWSCDFVAEAPR